MELKKPYLYLTAGLAILSIILGTLPVCGTVIWLGFGIYILFVEKPNVETISQ